jgi:AcrR family transcriptional regulator
MTFRRARSEEQREERRRAILETTAAMLAEMPVSEVSLNEISRRVCLAKSNVLRYVESREAALLALLHARVQEWLVVLDAAPPATGTLRTRVDALADLLATSLAERPVLCDLLGAQAAVLERNVSTDVAREHKRAMLESLTEMVAVVRRHVRELTEEDATRFAGAAVLCVGTVWTSAHPSAAMLAAYDQDEALAGMRLEFAPTLRELLGVVLSGLLARAAEPTSSGPTAPSGPTASSR